MRKIGPEFIEKTKYRYLEKSDQMLGKTQPPLEIDPPVGRERIILPKPQTLKLQDIPLSKAINNRRSVRSYSPESISLEELSYLLWCTQGVQETMPGHATLRPVPSAGARHAFETYLLVNNVEGLNPGIYFFIASDHTLIHVNDSADTVDLVTIGCHGQGFVRSSGATFMWVAVPYRMTWRYTQRGYRYLHLDAGHVCQNLYLASETMNCGVCAIAAFDDDMMNQILNIDGETQFIIYLATVGKKKLSF